MIDKILLLFVYRPVLDSRPKQSLADSLELRARMAPEIRIECREYNREGVCQKY